MHPDAVLAPAGILEVDAQQLNVSSARRATPATSWPTAWRLWWTQRRAAYPDVRRLLIDLDNGPEIASSRTQFMKRLVEFSDRHQLTLELAYYPPYHSKYNPIERCWGILENHWNGALLIPSTTALAWAKTMTWRGVAPIVHLLDRVYETGVRLTKAAFRPIAARLERSEHAAQMEPRDQPKTRVDFQSRPALNSRHSPASTASVASLLIDLTDTTRSGIPGESSRWQC